MTPNAVAAVPWSGHECTPYICSSWSHELGGVVTPKLQK